MKAYSERYIKDSEIMQLVILHALYSLKESKDVYFQGGTAIRWCYGGSRFSEDMDFVTHLVKEGMDSLIHKTSEQVRKGMVAHFGPGEFEIKQRKTARSTSHVSFFQFHPEKERKKISVKVEFEELKEGFSPETKKMILSMLPFVRSLITAGEFRIPYLGSIIVVETKEEILSDKIRALLEREYLKGRDFYDIWFLTSLNVRCDISIMKRKIQMYKAPFIYKRKMNFFLSPGREGKNEIIKAIRQDLSRFLPPQEMSLFENSGFKEMIGALKVAFKPFKNDSLFISESEGVRRGQK